MADTLNLATMDRALEGFTPFTPFTFDASPLQKFLQSILKQVELCHQENASLKAELHELKVGQRLDTLEQSLQELADLQRPGTGYGAFPMEPQANQFSLDGGPGMPGTPRMDSVAGTAVSTPAQGSAQASPGQMVASPAPAQFRGAAGDASWIIFEFNTLKERLAQMERKAEALWHVQEEDEALRGVVDRLKHDVDSVRTTVTDVQSAGRSSQSLLDHLERAEAASGNHIRDLQDKMTVVEAHLIRANEDKKELGAKLENNVNLIWDQIRHVENSLSQRLTLAETSQISTLQEVDEMKESANEVLGRVEDVKRHIAALENKLESFNTQVAAALSPLHSSLADVKMRLDDLEVKKQDTATAVSLDDVNIAVSRAIDHADRRTDNIIKSIGAMEERVEELNDLKANKCDVVMTTDLEALLTAHAAELDRHLDALKDEIMKVVGMKADKEEMANLDAKLGARISSLENAILKGLKAISDKVSAALAEKLDLSRFNEFKVQVRAILADVEDRLKDWSPMALGSKATMDGMGMGATSCLCCDSRVRSVKDMQAMGFSSADKVFCPEKLPHTEGLLPSIQRSPDTAAYNNAKYAQRKKDVANILSKSAAGIPEALPGHSGHGQNVERRSISTVDAGALLGVDVSSPDRNNSGSRVKVDVETISGTIAQGRIPSVRGVNRGPHTGQTNNVSPWETGSLASPLLSRPGGQPTSDLQIDTTQRTSSR